jgi:branched-chain amino acid transport system ATP-binding protein
MNLLEARNTQAFYGDFQALFGVDLDVAAGELVGVVGANGAGKSTLLKRLSGLMRGPADSVRLGGRPSIQAGDCLSAGRAPTIFVAFGGREFAHGPMRGPQRSLDTGTRV